MTLGLNVIGDAFVRRTRQTLLGPATMTTPSISIGTARPLRPTPGRRRRRPASSPALCCFGLLFSLAVLAVLVGTQLCAALPVFAERGVDFLTSDLSSNPANAGVAQGLIGTALLVVIVALVAFPIGIMTAIYLEEYSADNRLARFIDINIRNLAGVPSVVYGILGLTVFVALFAGLGDGNGKTVVTGGLTLAVLILPLVIITSAEAIRAVPNALREAGFGLGASRWQVVRKLILPAAAPGILTGTVLSLSRAHRRDRAAHPRRGGPRLVLDRRQPRSSLLTGRTPRSRRSSSTGRASRSRSSRR